MEIGLKEIKEFQVPRVRGVHHKGAGTGWRWWGEGGAGMP